MTTHLVTSIRNDAENKSILHIVVIPLLIFVLGIIFENQYTFIGVIGWVLMIAFLNKLRIYHEPSKENILRYSVFMDILKYTIMAILSIVSFILILVIA